MLFSAVKDLVVVLRAISSLIVTFSISIEQPSSTLELLSTKALDGLKCNG